MPPAPIPSNTRTVRGSFKFASLPTSIMISNEEWAARRRDTYARLLVHAEPELGYPLWLTTPTEKLAPKYPHKDIQIGDVGIVTPHGNFDVFFNICLPENHPMHHQYGVPEGFEQIKLSEKDVEIIQDPDYRGCIVTAQSFSGANLEINVTGANPNIVKVKGGMDTEVAVLAVPITGADKHDLCDTSVFQMAAMRMGETWYEFALNKLGWTTMGHDSLYLITGYHKVVTRGVDAVPSATTRLNIDVQYKPDGAATVNHEWGSRPLGSTGDCRRFENGGVIATGQGSRGQANAQKTYAISVRGFKIAINEKTFHSLLPSPSPSKGTGPIHSTIPSSLQYRPPIRRIYHPLDKINSILLNQTRHCEIVVTHDNMWKDIVQELPSIRSRSRRVMAAIKKRGYAVSEFHVGTYNCAYFTKCGENGPTHSSDQGFTHLFKVSCAVANLVRLVMKKEKNKPKYIDDEEKTDKASLGSICSE